MSPELHHQLLEAAARLQVTPSEIITAALRQYLEKLQTPDSNTKTADILDRLVQLERRVEALESAKRIHDEMWGLNDVDLSIALRFIERFKGCGPIDLKRCRSWWPARRKPSMNEIRKFLVIMAQMGCARWVDSRRVEIL